MPVVLRSHWNAHRERLFLAAVLLVSSGVALAMLAFRLFYSGAAGYLFMPWNLFLAWIPLWLAVGIVALRRRGRAARGPVLALALLWLLFFPNAPYLVTEFIHLHPHYAVSTRPLRALAGISPGRPVPVWYDAAMILTFAWNGLLLCIVSLHVVQHAVRRQWGAAWGWATVVVVLGLSGFGVSLGRFERWNSWDLFSRPLTLLADVGSRVLNPLDHARTTAVTIVLSCFLLLAYLSIAAVAAVRSATPGERAPS